MYMGNRTVKRSVTHKFSL